MSMKVTEKRIDAARRLHVRVSLPHPRFAVNPIVPTGSLGWRWGVRFPDAACLRCEVAWPCATIRALGGDNDA